MIKYLLPILLFISPILDIRAASDAQATHYVEEPSIQSLDSAIETALKKHKIPGAAVGIVVDGKIVHAKGYGYRDLGKKLPVTTDTVFAVASCSKAFTAFIIGTLVDEGKLNWDDRVIDHLPDFKLLDKEATEKMTIRDLLTHSSGLARHDDLWYGSRFSRHEIFKRLRYLEPTHRVGEKFQYNNLMYMVAGLVVEKVSGESWEHNVQKRIFDPLAMDRSQFAVKYAASNHSFAYDEIRGKNRPIRIRDTSNIGPAASISSSLSDMNRWVAFQFSKGEFNGQSLIDSSTLSKMHRPQFSSQSKQYGYGWYIRNYSGLHVVEHGGAIDGFRAHVSLYPQKKIGVIILTNHESYGDDFIDSVKLTIERDIQYGLQNAYPHSVPIAGLQR